MADSAYLACHAAAEDSPNDSALVYRVAISALWSDRPDEAIQRLREADNLNACGAAYFLGDEAMQRNDLAQAKQFYERSAACGDRRAQEELYPASVFAHSAHPEIMHALASDDPAAWDSVGPRFLIASYMEEFYGALSEQYLDSTFSNCWTTRYYKGGVITRGLRAAVLGDPRSAPEAWIFEMVLPKVFMVLKPQQGTQSLTEYRDSEKSAGRADLYKLVRATKCGSYLPTQIITSVEAWSRRSESLVDVVRRTYPQVKTLNDLKLWADGKLPATR